MVISPVHGRVNLKPNGRNHLGPTTTSITSNQVSWALPLVRPRVSKTDKMTDGVPCLESNDSRSRSSVKIVLAESTEQGSQRSMFGGRRRAGGSGTWQTDNDTQVARSR